MFINFSDACASHQMSTRDSHINKSDAEAEILWKYQVKILIVDTLGHFLAMVSAAMILNMSFSFMSPDWKYRSLGTNFSEIRIKIRNFSFMKMRWRIVGCEMTAILPRGFKQFHLQVPMTQPAWWTRLGCCKICWIPSATTNGRYRGITELLMSPLKLDFLHRICWSW